MEPITAGLMLGGGLLSFLGGQSQASAQQRMAMAQEQAARDMIAERRKERAMALRFAAPSTTELDAQRSLLDLQSQVLGRTQRELSFLQRGLDINSPGAAEAGQGLFSSILARTRANQRVALESRLRQRFGAGYATTSAGQQALQSFDVGTADLGVQAIPQFLQTAYGAIGQTSSLENALKARQIAAAQATPVSSAIQAGIPQFGAANVGAIQGGAALAGLGNTLASFGGQMYGYQQQQQLQQNQMNMFRDMFASSPVQMQQAPAGITYDYARQQSVPAPWTMGKYP